MKQESDYFEGHEPVLIYIAKRLGDALKLEGALTATGVNYGVEPDKFMSGVVFQSERVGAFFYVLAEEAESARGVVRAEGLRPL